MHRPSAQDRQPTLRSARPGAHTGILIFFVFSSSLFRNSFKTSTLHASPGRPGHTCRIVTLFLSMFYTGIPERAQPALPECFAGYTPAYLTGCSPPCRNTLRACPTECSPPAPQEYALGNTYQACLAGRSPSCRNALWDAFLACLAGRSPSAPQEHASGDALQVQYRVTTLCRLSYSNSKSIL